MDDFKVFHHEPWQVQRGVLAWRVGHAPTTRDELKEVFKRYRDWS